MKIRLKSVYLQILAISAGILGFLLRMILFTTGIDAKGMLIDGHWTRIPLLYLTFFLCALLLICCRSVRLPAGSPSRLQGLTAGAGCFLAAAGFLATAVSGQRLLAGGIDALAAVFCFLAAAAMVFIGINRCLGRKPHYLAHTAVCLAFALQMICQYRNWSSDPQLFEYCFQMLALVALMLTAYHCAAIDGGMGGFRRLWFFGLLALYFSIVSVYANSGAPLLLLYSLWAATNLPCFCDNTPSAADH